MESVDDGEGSVGGMTCLKTVGSKVKRSDGAMVMWFL